MVSTETRTYILGRDQWVCQDCGEDLRDEDRRDMEHSWAREILQQCRDENVPFHFKQSSASTNESGTLLSVKNEDYGVFEQREIREFPPVPDVTQEARREVVT